MCFPFSCFVTFIYLSWYSDRTMNSQKTATISKAVKLLIILIQRKTWQNTSERSPCWIWLLQKGEGKNRKAREKITMNKHVQNTLLLMRSHIFAPRIGHVFAGALRYRRDQNMDFFTQFCFFSDLIRPHFSNHLPRRWNNSFHNVCAICYKKQKQYMAQMLLGLCLNQKEYI